MNQKNIEILRVFPLRGPNLWTYRPTMEAWVDIGDLEDFPSNTLPGFNDRLIAWLPSLIEHQCSEAKRGGFIERLREGTWPGHILEHVTIELLNLSGLQTGFGKARMTSQRGIYKVVFRSRCEEVSKAALYAARDLIMAAIEDRPYDLATKIEELKELVDDYYLGPSTASIVAAATDRDIPSIRLNEGNLVQLGYGARQRRIWTAETDRTSAIAEGISRDKDLTKTLLESCGIPVPEGRIVASPEDAWEAAEDIGLPVVVKPTDGNHGRGVSTELMTREEVMAAFPMADAEGSEVIVESYIRGDEHRILVINNKVVAVARGEIIHVHGDGKSSIRELIKTTINTDPRRGSNEGYPLDFITLNEPSVLFELKRQNFTPESVPAAGQAVLVQRKGNMCIDVTGQIHPANAKIACLAAKVIGLDIAGIDLVVEDISKPMKEQGGAIVEVNAGPGLLMHLKPAEGTPQPVGQAIVDSLFDDDDDGRIEIIGISGSSHTKETAQLVFHLTRLRGQPTGLACRDGVFLDKQQLEKADGTKWDLSSKLLLNRNLETAIFESSSRTIISEGLPYDRCQVGVVTSLNPAEQHPDYYVENEEQIFNLLRTQIDVVLNTGTAVLNADDITVASMAELSDGDVIFFSQQADNATLSEHVAQGNKAVFVRNGRFVLAEGDRETALSTLAATNDLLAAQLPAIATAWALGVDRHLISIGLSTFKPT